MRTDLKVKIIKMEVIKQQTANLERIKKALQKESKNKKITPEIAEASARKWLGDTPFEDLGHVRLQQLAMFMDLDDPYILAVLAYRTNLSYNTITEETGELFYTFALTHRNILCEMAEVVKGLTALIYDFEKQTLSDSARLLFEENPKQLFAEVMADNPRETDKLTNLMNFMIGITDASTDIVDIYYGEEE